VQEFEIIGHTSEVGFKAYGKTLNEAFEHAGKAVFSLMVTNVDSLPIERHLDTTIKSEDLESLLYDFIDELIYRRDTEQLLFSQFDVDIIERGGGYTLHATIGGCDMADIPAQDVKSPTYSDIAVEETDEGWTVRMVVDV